MEFITKQKKIRAFQIQKPIESTDFPTWFDQAVFAGRIVTYPEQQAVCFAESKGNYEKAYPLDWLCLDEKSRLFKLTSSELMKDYEAING